MCSNIDAFNDLEIAIGFVQIADFNDRWIWISQFVQLFVIFTKALG